MESCKIWIKGKVQGVWFRASAKKEADRLRVKGFVENELDGSVYAEAEGAQAKKFVDWCRKGSQFASVEEIRIESQAVQGFKHFEIRR
ncbi:MAG: acylphosphatase [Bacteroidetes bacterium]|nr:acylphosphatase [Bacteroidota bacterium]